MASLSSLVHTGRSREPLRVLLHGVEGVGKTTFAAGAPDAVFVGPEDGGGDLDIARITVTTWAELLAAVDLLLTDEHSFRVVVLDTVDFLERLCHQMLTKGTTSLEKVEGGYGKGYKMAAEEQAKLIAQLDRLRTRRRMAVIALAHTEIKKFDDPTEAAYDRYQIRMHKEAAGLWSGWADCILFANFDVKVRVAPGGNGPEILKKGKAVDRPIERVLYTQHRPAFDAKNRYGLPFEIPLSWADFAEAIAWDRRAAESLAVVGAAEPEQGPTASDVALAMGAAKKRGWTKDQLMAVVDSFGATKGSEITPNNRAGAIRAFSGDPITNSHSEA